MHLFRLFDYNGPARLSLNTCVYRRKYFLTVSQFDCWAQWRTVGMTMCSGDPDTARPSVAALSWVQCVYGVR